jgi:plastocyanin
MTRTVLAPQGRIHAAAAALAIAVLCIAGTPARAGEARIEVLSREGNGVPNVAIVLERPGAPKPSGHRTARMDQQDRKFVPQVLVIDTGTQVDFPNSDQVSHQVYSFSPAHRFQLPLYKGAPHAPVTFPQPGLVVLGCNIHDEMIGYILVTESPYHASTDAAGSARIRDLPAGTYQVTAWGPLIHDGGGSLTGSITVTAEGGETLTLRLRDALRRSPSPRPGRVDWDGY